MCFICQDTQEHFAEEDIQVYKLLRYITSYEEGIAISHLVTYYQETPVTLYKLQPQVKIEIEEISNYYPSNRKTRLITEGYHSYKEPAYSRFIFPQAILYKAYIPKGTRYFENDTEIVSENLVITEKIKEI